MGGGVGDLASKASGALGGLGQSIGDKSGGTTDGIVTGIPGNLGNTGGTGANGAPAGNQEVVNSLLQGVFGQQAQPATEAVETPASTGPAAVSPQNIPLPKSDPRGIIASAPPPAEPASPTDQLVDAIVPQSAPEGKEGTNDLIKGLINQIGM